MKKWYANNKQSITYWFKRVGFIGFLFFLAKGLLWLLLAYVVLK